MNRCKISLMVLLLMSLSLVACDEKNPLLGSWQVVSIKADDLMTQFSLNRHKELHPRAIRFTEKEMGVVFGEQPEKLVPVYYKKVSEKCWAFSVDNTTWNEILVENDNTLIRKEKKPSAEIIYRLERK